MFRRGGGGRDGSGKGMSPAGHALDRRGGAKKGDLPGSGGRLNSSVPRIISGEEV